MHRLNLPQKGARKDIYEAILPQIEAVVSEESDAIANMANVAAILKEALDFLWVGFYRLVADSNDSNHQLVLGPFQGPMACTRIAIGRGVCGMSAMHRRTIIVPDVNRFEGHIACSSLSKSEIVVPVFDPSGHTLLGVLDIDSTNLDDFSELDKYYLEQIISILSKC